MKHIYKNTLLLILVLALAGNSMTAFASSQNNYASYDLKKGGTQTFYILNEDEDYEEIIVEEISGNTRVDNGTYKITYKALAWEAGFYLTISNNKVTNAYSPFYEAFSGKISNPLLTRNSNITATYSFIHTFALVKHNTGVIASIEDNNLIISKK